jgi:hypothetical protein
MTPIQRRTAQSLAIMAIGVLAFSWPTPVPAQSGAKIATCQVYSGGNLAYNGRCRFTLEDGGSFTIEHADPNRTVFYGEIASITVSIVSPGTAEVRGLTRQGVNSRWGQAQRSNDDRACWEGSDFKICAR